MTSNAASIRDNLANDLGVLEPGLGLIETEHPLKNAHGTSGRIDILANERAIRFPNVCFVHVLVRLSQAIDPRDAVIVRVAFK